MIRVVIENILLFLLPTVVYALFVAATRTDAHKGILEEAPLFWLLAIGSLLVVVVLAAFGSNTGGVPGQAYEPPSMKNGEIQPGRLK